MKFTRYADSWGWIKKLSMQSIFATSDEYFDTQIAVANIEDNVFTFRQMLLERKWIDLNRPYYNCFPAIVPMFCNLKLDIPCSCLNNVHIQPLELRLPDTDKSLSWVDEKGKSHRVISVLFGIQEMPSDIESDKLIPGLSICFDVGELHEVDEYPIMHFKFFPLREDLTIEEASNLFPPHDSWAKGIVAPNNVVQNLIKLCACVILIGKDPDIIRPDVLVKDANKWLTASEEEREAMFAKAKKRGKFGWNVGAGIESLPHFRRPHPALVWTEKGRTTPKIVMRKGSVIHRQKLVEVPTGFSN